MWGRIEPARTAVVRVGAALDQPGLLHTVDHAAHRDRLDLGPLGQRALVLARVVGDRDQHPPLGPGQPVTAGGGIETLAQQPRDVVEIKPQIVHKER
jgi:hypothetical protein